MTRKRSAKPPPEYAVSDAAAAYIADALMELALKFEASHFAQIRRHHKSIAPERDADAPWQFASETDCKPAACSRALGLPSQYRPPTNSAVAKSAAIACKY